MNPCRMVGIGPMLRDVVGGVEGEQFVREDDNMW